MSSWTVTWRGSKESLEDALNGGKKAQAELDAYHKAHAVARYMGKGWKPVVWQNSGWHWQVVKEGIQVSPSLLRKKEGAMIELISPIPETVGIQFSVMFRKPGCGGGMIYDTVIYSSEGRPSCLHIDPKEAVRRALAINAEHLRERIEALERARTEINRWGLEAAEPPWWRQLVNGTLSWWIFGKGAS